MEVASRILLPSLLAADAPIHGAEPQLVVRGLSMSFGGLQVLDDLTWELQPSEIALIHGENGSGKSTLLNVLTGFVRPQSGFARLAARQEWLDVTKASPVKLARCGVGRLWQQIRLFPTMTVLDNVLAASPDLRASNPVWSVLARPHVLRQEREATANALQRLALFRMDHRSASYCDSLSVGEMKRVALARLLQMEPSILFLDEPLSGLDSRGRSELLRDLRALRTQSGASVVIVEHRIAEVSDIADRRWRLRNGRLESSEN